jgi:hypothetical protein
MDLKMTSPNGATYGFISMEYSILSPEMSSILKENDVKQKDIEKYLDLMYPHFLSGFARSFDNFNQVEEPDYVKYQVDGHKTGSAVFGFTLKEQNLAGLMVWTLIGGNQFWFMYAANADNFDQGLPTAEKVLESIKILPKQVS